MGQRGRAPCCFVVLPLGAKYKRVQLTVRTGQAVYSPLAHHMAAVSTARERCARGAREEDSPVPMARPGPPRWVYLTALHRPMGSNGMCSGRVRTRHDPHPADGDVAVGAAVGRTKRETARFQQVDGPRLRLDRRRCRCHARQVSATSAAAHLDHLADLFVLLHAPEVDASERL